MQFHTQSGNITTYLKVEVELTLPEINAKKILTWNFHVDESTEGRYDMILGGDLLTELGLNLK